MRPRARSAQGGFTVMEILVALVVMMIGLAGVLKIYVTAARGGAEARQYDRARSLAEDALEQLRGRDLALIALTAGQEEEIETAEGVVYRRAHRLDPIEAAPELVRITVEVSYGRDGDEEDRRTARLQLVRNRTERM